MKTYLGVKLVNAEPTPRKISGPFEPLSVEDGYKVVYPDGYVSWSPKDVFEEAYREIHGLTFGLAIEAMKKGLKVARRGWNGKGMWLCLVKADQWIIPAPPFVPDKDGNYTPDGGVPLVPFIGMFTADKKFVPWLASQTDMLAEDWEVVE